MGPGFATSIVHNHSPGDEGFEEAFEDIHKENEVWDMATDFTIQNVIKPQDTREYLIRMLDVYRIRRDGGIGEHYMQSWPTSY